MATRSARADEFEVRGDEVTHRPDQCALDSIPGDPLPHLQNPGMLGSVLPSGDEYREDDVLRIALKLLRERPVCGEATPAKACRED
jgi:hypothetical protein